MKKLITALLCLAPLGSFATTPGEKCQLHFDNADWGLAAAPCTTAAEDGDLNAQTILGELYDRGKGVERNAAKTLHWWKTASDAGHGEARNLLALKYYYGGTVLGPETEWPQDHQAAHAIWHEDAMNGVAASQFMVGVLYQEGKGVEQDYAEAWAWLKLALEGRYKLATDVLMELSRVMSGEDKRRGMERLDELRTQVSKPS